MIDPKKIMRLISQKISVDIRDLEERINNIKKEYGIDDIPAILQFIAEENLSGTKEFDEILFLIRLGSMLYRINMLRPGIKGVNIVGRVETFSIFERNEGDSIAKHVVILINDGTGYAQAYLKYHEKVDIAVSSIIYFENIHVKSQLDNRVFLIELQPNGQYGILREDIAEEFFFQIPKIQIFDIADITDINITDTDSPRYIHIEGIYLGRRSSKNPKIKELLIYLGSPKDRCKTKLPIHLRGAAIIKFNNTRAEPGERIIIHGAFLKRIGERTIVIARNLALFEIQGVWIESVVPEDGAWQNIPAQIRSKIIFGEYQYKERSRRYAKFFAFNPEIGSFRVLVWNEKLLSSLETLKKGDYVLVLGAYRTTNGTIEVHVQSNLGFIKPISKDEFDSIYPPETAEESAPIITEITNLKKGTLVTVIMKLLDLEEIKSTKLHSIATLTDGETKIKLLIWSNDLFEKLEPWKGALLKITNLWVSTDRREPTIPILLARRDTKIEVIADNYDYKMWYNFGSKPFTPIPDLKIGEESYLYGAITNIEWRGTMLFCKKCGSLIVDAEKQVCELGHIGYAYPRNVVIFILDDGFGSTKVLIPENKLVDLLGEEFFSDPERYMGTYLCVRGKLKLTLDAGKPNRIFMADGLCEAQKFEPLISIAQRMTNAQNP